MPSAGAAAGAAFTSVSDVFAKTLQQQSWCQLGTAAVVALQHQSVSLQQSLQ